MAFTKKNFSHLILKSLSDGCLTKKLVKKQ